MTQLIDKHCTPEVICSSYRRPLWLCWLYPNYREERSLITSLFTDDEEELPLNLSTKNRQIWSPGSACERECGPGAGSPGAPGRQDEAPLELVKRSRSPDERPPSADPCRCPSAPSLLTYPTLQPPTDHSFSLISKSENRTEKSFQVRLVYISIYYMYYI